MMAFFRLTFVLLCAVFAFTSALGENETALALSTHDIDIVVNQLESFLLFQSKPISLPCSIIFAAADGSNIAQVYPSAVQLRTNESEYLVNVLGRNAGRVIITAKSVPSNNTALDTIYLRVTVANNHSLVYISNIVGWLYFVAWSVSFYPQIYTNYRRGAVTGLNFDFLALNLIGFALYTAYNVAMFWSERLGAEYAVRYPHGQMPVLANDVVFSVHALLATLLTIGQCTRYERGAQRVSLPAWLFAAGVAVLVAVLSGLGVGSLVKWLDVLTYCSYIKLVITLVKYVPQAVMNYQRKSTVGWSIGNIFLDLTGGVLSVLQMVLNAYNFNDWNSIFGDPTKFGLGLFSVLFDVFFMVQHYVFYRHASPYMELSGETEA